MEESRRPAEWTSSRVRAVASDVAVIELVDLPPQIILTDTDVAAVLSLLGTLGDPFDADVNGINGNSDLRLRIQWVREQILRAAGARVVRDEAGYRTLARRPNFQPGWGARGSWPPPKLGAARLHELGYWSG